MAADAADVADAILDATTTVDAIITADATTTADAITIAAANVYQHSLMSIKSRVCLGAPCFHCMQQYHKILLALGSI